MSAIKKYLRVYRTFLVYTGIFGCLVFLMELGSRIWPSEVWLAGQLFPGAVIVTSTIIQILAIVAYRLVPDRFNRRFQIAAHVCIMVGLIYWIATLSQELEEVTASYAFVFMMAYLFGLSLANLTIYRDALDVSQNTNPVDAPRDQITRT